MAPAIRRTLARRSRASSAREWIRRRRSATSGRRTDRCGRRGIVGPSPAAGRPPPWRRGRNLATSPGSVVLRTPMFELIQYAPRTERVHAVPMLLVSSMVNKYYVLDLSPGRSLVEYLVDHGHTVFAISWRNPEPRNADWDLDRYA